MRYGFIIAALLVCVGALGQQTPPTVSAIPSNVALTGDVDSTPPKYGPPSLTCAPGEHIVLTYTEKLQERSICGQPTKCVNGDDYGLTDACECKNGARPVLNDQGEVTSCLSPLTQPDGAEVPATVTLVPVTHWVPTCPDGYSLWRKAYCSNGVLTSSGTMVWFAGGTTYQVSDQAVDPSTFEPDKKPTDYVCRPNGSSAHITTCPNH